jgi:hypothetical protein
MASILKHLRSSTANKRPTASGLADGQIAINTASGTPAMFFKDSAGNVVKVGPAHVGTSAPNASPAGSAGNSTGELWVDNSLTTPGLNYYTGSAFVNLTPSGTTSTVGLVELATNAETQAGSDAVRAVTSAGLQSKLSDSTSTTSSTTIASSTAVKSAYDLANAALPKSGGTLTGELLISPSGSLVFEGSSDDSFETTIAVTNPTADRTITFPNVTGTVITTGDTGSVTSTMIANDTIVDADINASAAIAPSKLGSGALPSGVTVASANIVDGTIVNADVNASAAIAGTKISPDFGGQNVVTTGNVTGAALIPSSSTVPTNGVYLPSANNVAISTNGTGRLFVDASGSVGVGVGNPNDKLHVLESSASAAAATSASVAQFERAGNAAITVSTADSGAASIYFGDTASSTVGTIQYNHSDNSLLFGTNNAERLRITSDGKLGLGTSAPGSLLHTTGSRDYTGSTPNYSSYDVNFQSGTASLAIGQSNGIPTIQGHGTGTSYNLALCPNAGRVGIGTTSPSEALEVAGNAILDATDATLKIKAGTTGTTGALNFTFNTDSTVYGGVDLAYDTRATVGTRFFSGYPITIQSGASTNAIIFKQGSTDERARVDSSGRLLVGTSTSRTADGYASGLQLEGTTNYQSASISLTHNRADTGAPEFRFCKSRGTSAGAVTLVNSGDILGRLYFYGTDGSAAIQAARISAEVDGTPGTNDMPGRLVFSTTADGASSPTERMRITSGGNVGIGTTSPGYILETAGDIRINPPSGNAVFRFGRAGSNDWAIYNDTSDNLVFYSDAGGAERARIDSSGRVGIGTTSPGANLDIAGATFANLFLTDIAAGASAAIYGDGGSIDLRANNSSDNSFLITSDSHRFRVSGSERARIDSSGRLLIGTSSAISTNGVTAGVELHSTATNNGASLSIARFNTDATAGQLILAKSRNATVAAGTIVQNGDELGQLVFNGDDGTDLATPAARIQCFVDGTPGLNDMPGRLVLSVTLDGASSPTEALRITNDRVIAYNQPDVTSKSAAATLTVAELKTGIIQYTGAAATLTLPTGTLTEGGFNGIYTNMTFEWSVINTGSGTCTIGAGTGHTIVGSTTVAAGASGRFASRRTAANTFVTYRLS